LFVVAPEREPQLLELLDFGIARVDADSELTQQGAVVGTPGFMAPEVLAGAPGGVPADIYGLGAALYFALTGLSPRDAKHVPPSAIVAGVPLELDDLIVRALDREPSRRPASADDLRDALAAIPAWRGSWPIDGGGTATTTIPADVDVPPTSDPSEPPTVSD
jgi:serine/threonine protein kinase